MLKNALKMPWGPASVQAVEFTAKAVAELLRVAEGYPETLSRNWGSMPGTSPTRPQSPRRMP